MTQRYTIIVRNVYGKPVGTERKLTFEQVLIRVAFHLESNNLGKQGSLEIIKDIKLVGKEPQ